ncbi:tyrosine-type recombinase/integrase [Miniimonas sp. S16]|uniref:tyrosine-type recombinase/integrase n=1 Tax=Miniimonas sp. S16 TaxID=2171623 RepID=UPI000D528E61|nr:tyrosine-type recombinase/integrase [Miniimonas sp. S16]
MPTRTSLPRGISMYRGKYRVRVTVDGVVTSIGVYETLTDARAALTLARADIVTRSFVSPAERRASARAEVEARRAEAITLAEWAQDWLLQLENDPRRSRATAVSYRSVLRTHWLPVLGEVRLVDLTTEMVAAHLDHLRKQPSSRYAGQRGNGVAPNAAQVLRSCLNAAVRGKVGGLTEFTFPVAPKHTRVRPEDLDGDVASPAEVIAMTEAMPEHLRIAVPLAAWCAMRLGEVLGLQRRDLEHLGDPTRAVLHIRRQWNVKAGEVTAPKCHSARSIAIPSFLLPQLQEHLATFVGPDPAAPVLAVQPHRTTRVSQTRFDVAWRAAREAAGRPQFRFHNLRHTGLTAYAQQGATLAELLNRGGHTDVAVALRYQHATLERDRALTDRLARAVGEPAD